MALLLRFATSPLLALALAAAFAAALLATPLRLPIGPNYWDIYTYVDTVYRMSLGQVPHVDFFVPVGSLGYGLYMAVTRAFPEAHTLLAVHFSILLVALPIMAVAAFEADRRSRMEAVALVLPFIFFALIPINGQELYPSPGFDGYGNYNRHTALMLYVLAAVLLYVERPWLATALGVVLLGLMFMTKITGLAIGLGLMVHAAFAGRLSWRGGIAGAVIVAVPLTYLQARYGLIAAYVEDIVQLVGVNTGSLLPRVLTVLSTKFDVVGAAGLLILVALWRERAAIIDGLRGLAGGGRAIALRNLIDLPPIWMISLLIGGAVFETQNTGSHEFILLWPATLLLFRDMPLPYRRREAVLLVLVAATTLPTVVSITHRAVRTLVSAVKYEAVNAPLLGPVGRVSAKPEIAFQSRAMLAHYQFERASYELLAKRNVLPSYILFSEIDFQVSWIVSVEQAAQALLAYEKANGKRFNRIASMDFVDPFPVMLKREPLKDMSIGNDPDRTLMKLHERAIREIASADAILLPKCPVTQARNAIADTYAPSLQGRRLVALTPCFQMLVKD
jgi:hypothetical protein